MSRNYDRSAVLLEVVLDLGREEGLDECDSFLRIAIIRTARRGITLRYEEDINVDRFPIDAGTGVVNREGQGRILGYVSVVEIDIRWRAIYREVIAD